MKKIICFQCKKNLDFDHKISFREECSHCGADLHICFNCRFYDEGAYNECRESSAEKVSVKDRNNYCEYFEPSFADAGAKALGKEKLLQTAEALFKKKE